MNIDTFIEEFNDRYYEKLFLVFNNVDNFFDFVEHKGKLSEIDLNSLWYSLEEYEEYKLNGYCLRILKQSGINYFKNFIYHLETIGDESYLEILGNGLHNLIEFFPHMPEHKFIESLYKNDLYIDESSFNYFYNVYKNLNPENKIYFKNLILEYFSDVQLELDDFMFNTGEIENYLVQDENTFSISDNIDEILRNDSIFSAIIFTDVFTELRENLFNLYDESYRLARKHKGEKLILYSLRNIFYPKIYNIQGNNYLKFKNLYSILENYFNCMSDYRENILFEGSIEGMILNLIGYGCFPEIEFDPEEPDSKDVSMVMNDLFTSYI